MKSLFKIYWLLKTQIGIDPRALLRSLIALPGFLQDYFSFRKQCAHPMNIMPCFQDKYEEGGETRSEYFWQDLIVAQMIFTNQPDRHIDIGSRIDGFVAHLASFRNIDVIDVRPINRNIPGINFKQADLMKPNQDLIGLYDSLSCLHALEHFGLGRYGDTISADGFKLGLKNMASLLRKHGKFYLSVPIGSERVEFNANWIFAPETIIDLARKCNLLLTQLTVIETEQKPSAIVNIDVSKLNQLSQKKDALGIFVFEKTNAL